MAHCNQCDLDWDARVDHPVCCPRCKRYDWSERKKYRGNVDGGMASGTVGKTSKARGEVRRTPGDVAVPKVGDVSQAVAVGDREHDPKTCRVYKCGLCAAKEMR